MKFIPLTNSSRLAIVDDEDYEKYMKFTWSVYDRNHAKTNQRPYKTLHKFIQGNSQPSNLWTDHKNNDGLDCRKENMRPATPSQNGQNRRISSWNTSGFKGVSFDGRRDRNRHWRAYIKVEGRVKALGYFLSAIGAAKAYDRAAKKFFGEFAKPNFPMRFPRTIRFPRLREGVSKCQ